MPVLQTGTAQHREYLHRGFKEAAATSHKRGADTNPAHGKPGMCACWELTVSLANETRKGRAEPRRRHQEFPIEAPRLHKLKRTR